MVRNLIVDLNYVNPHSKCSGFRGSRWCSWTFALANIMQVSYISYFGQCKVATYLSVKVPILKFALENPEKS